MRQPVEETLANSTTACVFLPAEWLMAASDLHHRAFASGLDGAIPSRLTTLRNREDSPMGRSLVLAARRQFLGVIALTLVVAAGVDAKTGGNFILGGLNTASETTTLRNTAQGPALALVAKQDEAPLAVNSGVVVPRLNASLLNGIAPASGSPNYAPSGVRTSSRRSTPRSRLAATSTEASLTSSSHRAPACSRPLTTGRARGTGTWRSTSTTA